MTPAETYTIRPIDAANFQLLLPLMQDCFGIDTDLDYFRWKYVQNPAGSVVGFVAVADSNGEVGAYYGAIPELFERHGQREVVYQSCDTMTHSRHRRRGLFQLLAVHCYNYLRDQGQGHFFVYGYGGAQSMPGLLKFGWRYLFDVAYFFYPRQFALLDVGRWLAPTGRITTTTDYGSIADLLLRSNAQAKVRSLKEVPQFAWRLSNPRHQYETLASHGINGQPDGYLVFYRESNKLFLFDFYADNRAAEKALFRTLKGKLEPHMKGIVALHQEDTPLTQALRRNLFMVNNFGRGPMHEKIPFTFYADEATTNADLAPALWSIGAYDNDAL